MGEARARRHTGGPRRRTTAEFVTLAKSIHGGSAYDYSATVYATAHTKVEISCPAHGMFLQTPNAHLRGSGCPTCGHAQRSASQIYDTGWFIEESKKIHGTTYDYSGTSYLGVERRLLIRCMRHGVFSQVAGAHLRGMGCVPCGNTKKGESKRMKLDEFRSRGSSVHGVGRYDYSSVELVAQIIPVTIVCPSHGPFSQRPHKHLRGDGCPSCSESRGEREVRRVLTAMDVEFVAQWGHPRLRHRRPLSIDFAIPSERIAIEFDGAHHRRPVNYRGAGDQKARMAFEQLRLRDAIKTAWAESEGWKLIRITEVTSVAEILEAELGRRVRHALTAE